VEVGEPLGDSNDKMDDDSDDAFHALILIESRIVNGETFWTLQNSW
jgi:hypothetical protein